MTRRSLIAGNWKMNKTPQESLTFLEAFLSKLGDLHDLEVLLIPPYTSLEPMGHRLAGSPVRLGAQDAFYEGSGAYTAAVSVEMVAACGCRYVLAGHSERRHVFGDDDSIVARKLSAVLDGGLSPILCVGETLEQRRAGDTDAVLTRQLLTGLDGIDAATLSKIVVAYEPVWAIGTGETASPEQAQGAVCGIRGWLQEQYDERTAACVRILYGGSVKPSNALELLRQPDIDGALIGGASLDPEAFAEIVEVGGELAARG